ncbi:MAG: transcriptional repressor [Clostridiales bacterium]
MQKRNTRQRQMVLNAVLARRDHPTANQLYQDIRAFNPKISRGTVYRNLKILANSGKIHHLNVAGVEHFDWRLAAHGHLVCTECGALSDVPLPYEDRLDQILAEQTGYEIAGHHTFFEGRCPACQGGQSQAEQQPQAEQPQVGQPQVGQPSINKP